MIYEVKQKKGEYGFDHVADVDAESARAAVLKVAEKYKLETATLFAVVAKEQKK